MPVLLLAPVTHTLLFSMHSFLIIFMDYCWIWNKRRKNHTTLRRLLISQSYHHIYPYISSTSIISYCALTHLSNM